MREHMGLFRGKRPDNGEWVKGFYHYADWVMPPTNEFVKRTHSILPLKSQDAFDVDPATVGECTGLTDKNGKLIFEGDIVEYPVGDRYGGNLHKVVFERRGESGYFGITISDIETWQFCLEVPAKLMRVIGNIHDNPELTGGANSD